MQQDKWVVFWFLFVRNSLQTTFTAIFPPPSWRQASTFSGAFHVTLWSLSGLCWQESVLYWMSVTPSFIDYLNIVFETSSEENRWRKVSRYDSQRLHSPMRSPKNSVKLLLCSQCSPSPHHAELSNHRWQTFPVTNTSCVPKCLYYSVYYCLIQYFLISTHCYMLHKQ